MNSLNIDCRGTHVEERGKKFRGFKQFDYAEKIGLGSTQYVLIEV